MNRICTTTLLAVCILSLMGASPGQDEPDFLDHPCITDPGPIRAELEAGRERVRVIIGLVAPPRVEDFSGFLDPAALASHLAEVAVIEDEFLARLDPSRIHVRYRMQTMAAVSAEVTPHLLAELLDDPWVASIEPIVDVEFQTMQGIPAMHAQYARRVHDGAGLSVAIVDSGVDYTHAALGGGGFPTAKVIGGWDFSGAGDPDPMDEDGHGTSVAGTAAGDIVPDGDYVGGAAPGAKIYALKVGAGSSPPEIDKICAAWEWAVMHKMDDPDNPIVAVNTSIGGGRYTDNCGDAFPTFRTAFSNALASEIMIFCASGNDGFCDAISFPGCLALAVGAVYDDSRATTESCMDAASCVAVADARCSTTNHSCKDDSPVADDVACFSNSNADVWLLAPGQEARAPKLGGGYEEFGKTSAATAYASGAYLVYQSMYREVTQTLQPPLGAALVLKTTGDPILDPKSGVTTERINLRNAVAPLAPDNDFCAAAMPVVEDIVYNSWTTGATTDGPDEPSLCDDSGYSHIDADVWFSYTAPCSGDVFVSLCGSDFDTKVAIYEGGCPGVESAIACDDNGCGTTASHVTFTVVGGETYLIRVGGYQGETGTLELLLGRVVPNDECAQALDVVAGSTYFCTIGATTDGPPEVSCWFCCANNDIRNDIWYRYEAPCDGVTSVAVCDAKFDARLAVYGGGCPDTGALVTCDDNSGTCGTDAPAVSFVVAAGQEYWIRVGGTAYESGEGWLVLECGPNEIGSCQGIDGVDVLQINGSTGVSSDYTVQTRFFMPILFHIDKPSGGGNGKFVVHLNRGVPSPTSVTPLPAGLGATCFPFLLPGGATPAAIWTNLNKPTQIGTSNFQGSPIPNPLPAPVTFYDSNHELWQVFQSWTLQGVIVNPDASSRRRASVTNAVILEVTP